MFFRNKISAFLRKDFTPKEPFYYYFTPDFYFKRAGSCMAWTEDMRIDKMIQEKTNEKRDMKNEYSLVYPFSDYNKGENDNYYTGIFIAFLAFGMGVGFGVRFYIHNK